MFIYNKKEKNISKKLATLIRLHIAIDDEGFIRIAKDMVNTDKLRDVLEEDLPDWEDGDIVVRYTEHMQRNINELLKDSEKMFNFTDLF